MKINDLGANLTVINSFWRQIMRIRTCTHDNIYTRGRTPGNLSYTAEGVATKEQQQGGKEQTYWVVWLYWTHEAGSRVATQEDVEACRKRVGPGRYTGETVNGEELLVMSNDDFEKLRLWAKASGKLSIVGKYDLELFN